LIAIVALFQCLALVLTSTTLRNFKGIALNLMDMMGRVVLGIPC
jgi:hypothetical protein